MTSSPGLMYASAIMNSACLVGVTRTFFASQGIPFLALVDSAMAFLSSGIPREGV